MAPSFPLTITAIGESIFSGPVDWVSFPTEDGTFVVLHNHEATMALLHKGSIIIHTEEQTITCQIDKGLTCITGENDAFHVVVVAENPLVISKEGGVTQREIER